MATTTAGTSVTRQATIGLGLIGVGLGLAELLAPRRVNRLVGVGDGRSSSGLTRALGARELAVGLGVLGRRRPAPWLWARVFGDVIDLALLGAAGRARTARVTRVAVAIGAVLGVTVLDIFAASRSRTTQTARAARPVRKSITVAVAADRAYRFWRDLRNLPFFIDRLESVEVLDPARSRWRVSGPMGRTLEWEARIVDERENELIRWRSVEGADVPHRGEVRFRPAPGGRGTEISVHLDYVAPGGELGRAASLLSSQALQIEIERGLRRLKQIMEVGEVVVSQASPSPDRQPARPGHAARS